MERDGRAGSTARSFPLLARRRNGSWYADPGFGRTTWFPWLFTTGQGVAYSAPRGDANVLLLIFGWGAFIYAGMVALYFLARALWSADDGTGEAVPSGGTALRELKAGA